MVHNLLKESIRRRRVNETNSSSSAKNPSGQLIDHFHFFNCVFKSSPLFHPDPAIPIKPQIRPLSLQTKDEMHLSIQTKDKMRCISSSFPAIILSVAITLSSSSLLVLAQQPYVGLTTSDCANVDNSSVLGYTCNGPTTSCQSYLFFRSIPPYNTSASIAALLGSDSSQVAAINSVSASSASFDAGRLVIVPVNCSCSDQYYQVNASYVVQSGDGYFLIANNTYQALSTCQALQRVNNVSSTNLSIGQSIVVPVRCACPTKNQTDSGVNYLLNYPVTSGEDFSSIAARFSVDVNAILAANEISSTTLYAFTNLLIPSINPPNISETVSPPSPPPSAPPTFISPPSSKSSSKTWIYITVGVLGGCAVIVGTSVIFFFRRFRQRKESTDRSMFSKRFEAVEKPNDKKLEEDSQDFLESISSMAQSIKVYSFIELQQATDDFSPSCLIKGSVYRGKIKGDLAVIKKMNGDVSREVEILNKVNHFNVLKLSGICFDDGNWYFVYEYAINGSLDKWIFPGNGEGRRFLTWMQRVQIMLDVATGLNYLHYFTTPPLVHKDIRSSNVLLDGDMRAKIASLGLARSTETEEGEFAMTRHIVGTKGYMAPEYLENGLISVKLDVYAFGVLLLETISGKEVIDICGGENRQLVDVVVHALTREDEGRDNLFHFIDPSIREDCPLDLVLFIMRMIESCLHKNPAVRPSMDDIIQSLSKVLGAS